MRGLEIEKGGIRLGSRNHGKSVAAQAAAHQELSDIYWHARLDHQALRTSCCALCAVRHVCETCGGLGVDGGESGRLD